HHTDGREVVVPGGVSDLAAVGIGKTGGQIRILSEQGFDGGCVVRPASSEQFYIGRAAFHKQPEDVVVPELFGNVVRRDVPAERPLVNRSAGLVIGHGKILLTHTQTNAVGIGVEVPPN